MLSACYRSLSPPLRLRAKLAGPFAYLAGPIGIPRDPSVVRAQQLALLPIFMTFQGKTGGEVGRATY